MKIIHKIFFSIVLTAIASVIAVQLIQRHNFEQGFLRYTQNNRLERLQPVIDELASIYTRDNHWESLAGKQHLKFDMRKLNRFSKRISKHQHSPSHTPSHDNLEHLKKKLDHHLRPFKRKRALHNVSLLDQNKHWIAGTKIKKGGLSKPIIVNEQTVGFLMVGPLEKLSNEIDQQFAKQQFSGMFLITLLIIIGAGISAMLLSLHIGKPINILVKSVRNLSTGDYSGKANLHRKDEIGKLSNEFDKLIDTLAETRQQQRQWISDISHELRTPVTILMGEIECIEDGHTTLDLESLESLKMEVERLNLLINDLHQLSQSDSGTLTYDFCKLDMTQEIHHVLKSYNRRFEENHLTVECDLPEEVFIIGDSFRLQQLICNLIENTIRYTDSPGKIVVHGCVSENIVRVTIEDSSPGVDDDALQKIFNRLYRTDPSRSRDTGSSGLGLAICEVIIKAHHGQITARHSPLGGLAIDIDIPVHNEDK